MAIRGRNSYLTTTIASIIIIMISAQLWVVQCSNNNNTTSSSTEEEEEVDNYYRRLLSSGDLKPIRSIMDYCIDVLFDPSTPPPPKDVYPLNRLMNVQLCKEELLRFDRLVSEHYYENMLGGATFEEQFRKITKFIDEETDKIEDKKAKKLSIDKDNHIPDISVEDKQLLRYIMSKCVDQYNLTSIIDDHFVPVVAHNTSDYGIFCIEFFSKIEKFNGAYHKLEPAHVDALKEMYYHYGRSAS